MIKTKNKNAWLNEYAENITSQKGEDGIIRKILEIIPDIDNWCVEFGAWDGKQFSNTYNLIQNQNYSAVLIEANQHKLKDLKENFKDNASVYPINAFVGFEEHNNLDTILENTPIPINFDFLSVDIDGNDYYVWEAISKYRPKVVCVEFNPTIPNEVDFVQQKDNNTTQGCSPSALCRLAKLKGYELIAVTSWNVFFVDGKYFNLFNITDNSLNALRLDYSHITYLFTGYDGTTHLSGYKKLPWHSLPYKESRMQQLPGFLRKFPANYNIWQTRLLKLYKKFF